MIITAGALLGYRLLHGRLRLYTGVVMALLPWIAAAREEIAPAQRRDDDAASAQHRSSHRLPYSCPRRRDRSRRGLSRRDADWSIHFLVVDTSNWWSGEKVLISPRLAARSIGRISWLTSMSIVRKSRTARHTIRPKWSIEPTRTITTTTITISGRAIFSDRALLLSPS